MNNLTTTQILCVIIGVVLMSVFKNLGGRQTSTQADPYSDFLAQLSQGSFKSVTINGDQIAGETSNGSRFTAFSAGDEGHIGNLHKVNIMGDGNPFNADKTKFEFEDDRRLCNDNDLACKASGTLWCEDNVGNLVQAGSATVVSGEVVWNPEKKEFKIDNWPQPKGGSIRFITAGHNLYINTLIESQMGKKIVREPFINDCYFYPQGNEPMKYEHTSQETVLKKDFRRNESKLRLRVTKRVSNFKSTTRRNEGSDLEWTWGVLSGDLSMLGVEPTPIINLPDSLIQKLADSGAKIKQYGFNKEWMTVNVSESTGLFTKKAHYLNHDKKHIILDCNDTNGGASGGAATITVNVNYRAYEAVYGVRTAHMWATDDQLLDPTETPEPGPGEKCDPRVNANASRAIRGDFYDSLKSSITSSKPTSL